MGSKLKPGAFDCYANAEPDEPMFVLLGRDRFAPAMVLLWSALREKMGENPEKVAEARECAVSMMRWMASKGRKPIPPEDLLKALADTLPAEQPREGGTNGA